MARRKHHKKIKYAALLLFVAAIGVYFYWQKGQRPAAEVVLPAPIKKETGYKAEDRKNLEKLIHEGARHHD